MKRRDFLSLAGYSAASTMFPLGFALGKGVGSGRSRPDILLIMADDLGYSDIGCYGGEIETALRVVAGRGRSRP